jgi:hypothetical protein
MYKYIFAEIVYERNTSLAFHGGVSRPLLKQLRHTRTAGFTPPTLQQPPYVAPSKTATTSPSHSSGRGDYHSLGRTPPGQPAISIFVISMRRERWAMRDDYRLTPTFRRYERRRLPCEAAE